MTTLEMLELRVETTKGQILFLQDRLKWRERLIEKDSDITAINRLRDVIERAQGKLQRYQADLDQERARLAGL